MTSGFKRKKIHCDSRERMDETLYTITRSPCLTS